MTQTRGRKLSWGRARILLAAFALLALVLGPAAVNGTVAGWSDEKTSQGSFTAGSMDISGLTCRDNSVLGTLLGSEMRLDWQAPPGSGGTKLAYKVTVIKRRLLTSTTYEYTTTENYFTFRDPSLLNIATYELTVQAVPIGDWTGKSMTATGVGVTIVLGLALRCT